jgi:hypothetical protein
MTHRIPDIMPETQNLDKQKGFHTDPTEIDERLHTKCLTLENHKSFEMTTGLVKLTLEVWADISYNFCILIKNFDMPMNTFLELKPSVELGGHAEPRRILIMAKKLACISDERLNHFLTYDYWEDSFEEYLCLFKACGVEWINTPAITLRRVHLNLDFDDILILNDFDTTIDGSNIVLTKSVSHTIYGLGQLTTTYHHKLLLNQEQLIRDIAHMFEHRIVIT